MKTWDQHIATHAYQHRPSFREGYRAGWLDCCMAVDSAIARRPQDSDYTYGYRIGTFDFRLYRT